MTREIVEERDRRHGLEIMDKHLIKKRLFELAEKNALDRA